MHLSPGYAPKLGPNLTELIVKDNLSSARCRTAGLYKHTVSANLSLGTFHAKIPYQNSILLGIERYQPQALI